MAEHIRKQALAQAQAAPKPVEEEEDEPIEEPIGGVGVAEQLLTPADVAKLLGVGVRTLERWRREGEGPRYVQLSRKTIRYREEAVAHFVRGSEKSNTAQ
jgi:predicted DNA-binding transcriptional regulator AlpA